MQITQAQLFGLIGELYTLLKMKEVKIQELEAKLKKAQQDE